MNYLKNPINKLLSIININTSTTNHPTKKQKLNSTDSNNQELKDFSISNEVIEDKKKYRLNFSGLILNDEGPWRNILSYLTTKETYKLCSTCRALYDFTYSIPTPNTYNLYFDNNDNKLIIHQEGQELIFNNSNHFPILFNQLNQIGQLDLVSEFITNNFENKTNFSLTLFQNYCKTIILAGKLSQFKKQLLKIQSQEQLDTFLETTATSYAKENKIKESVLFACLINDFKLKSNTLLIILKELVKLAEFNKVSKKKALNTFLEYIIKNDQYEAASALIIHLYKQKSIKNIPEIFYKCLSTIKNDIKKTVEFYTEFLFRLIIEGFYSISAELLVEIKNSETCKDVYQAVYKKLINEQNGSQYLIIFVQWVSLAFITINGLKSAIEYIKGFNNTELAQQCLEFCDTELKKNQTQNQALLKALNLAYSNISN